MWQSVDPSLIDGVATDVRKFRPIIVKVPPPVNTEFLGWMLLRTGES